MQVDPAIVLAIMGIGVIGIIETIKRLTGLAGIGAIILAFAVSFGATAYYLYQAGTFTIIALILYGLIVFGEASGLYHIFSKKSY